MKTFTDTTARQWTLTLTLGTAMAVKAKLGIDLLQPESPRRDDPDGPPVLTLLGTDEMVLGEVLCCMLEGQFEKHQISAEQVREAFDGQTLLAAQQAFYEELIDFFRGRGRHDRAKAVAKQMAMIDAAISAAETKLDNLDPQQIVNEAISTPGISRKTPATARNIPGVGVGGMCGESPEASDSDPNSSGG